MNQKVLTFIKFIFLLAIAFLLLALAFRGISLKKIIREILHANLFWVLFSVFFSIVAFISRACRWSLLIQSAGYKPSLRKSTYSLMVGYFANLAFPRLGEITRCGALSRAESIPFNVLLGTVIVERVIDVISLLFCLLLACLLEFRRLGRFLLENIVDPILKKLQHPFQSPLMIALLIVGAAIIFFLLYFGIRKKKQNGESKPARLIRGLIDGLKSIGKLKKPGWFIFHSVLIWVLYYLSMYVSFFAFPFTSHLGLSAALLLLVAGGFGMSAPVQGGIGIYHLLVSEGLMLYGLSQQQGLTFATLVHTLSLVTVVVFGSLSLLFLFLEKKEARPNANPVPVK